jgi:hypothetical protein
VLCPEHSHPLMSPHCRTYPLPPSPASLRQTLLQVNKSGDWFEQAALMHLTKTYPEVAAHYMFVPQRAINSYPKECGNCSTGPYEVGD